MKRFYKVGKFFICGLFLALLFPHQEIQAQTKGKALIKGVVKDLDSKDPLPGASIVIVGTYSGTITDLEGEYSLFVTSGTFEIEISYIGNATKKVSVEIADGETKVINLNLEAEATQLSEVIIKGSLDGQRKALNQQRASDNLKNVISADQIGKFPDQNSAESLQRVSGINVQKDEGDGRFVLVRGLAPQFTNISINGEQIPSPEGGSRFVALDAIPANQLASLEVSKSLTPDMDGDAIGGSVNLITPMASKKKLSISGSAGMEYNDSSEKTTGQGSLTISKRSENDKFGFIISGSYSGSQKHSERMGFDGWNGDNPEGLEELELSDFEITRNRIGANTTLDYKIDDKNKIYLRGLYGELRELEQRRRLKLSSEEDDDELEFEVSKELKYRKENQGVYSFNLGGSHVGPKLKYDYEIAISKAYQNTPFNEKIKFENAEDVTWNINSSDRLSPQLTGFTYDGNSANISDTSLFEYDKSENEVTYAQDKNFTTKFNIVLPFNTSKNTGELKFGGKLRLKNKDFEVKDFVEHGYEGDETLLLNSFSDGNTFSGFMDGEFNQSIGAFPDRDIWNAFLNTNRGDFEEDALTALEEKALQEYDASEDVYAAYIQGKIQLNKLMILGGVRYEKTNFTYASGEWDEENEVATLITGTNDYAFLLPMLHFKYTITPNDILRASITKSYSRPNFEDLVQGATFDLNDEEASIFNPDLKPVKAVNLDLFAEHYFGAIGLLSGGVFYKKLDDFIYQQTTDQTFRGVNNIEVTQSINGDQATLLGFEIGYQQNLSFLPGILKGLVIYANYTYTSSNAEVDNFAQGSDRTEIDLPGQSESIGNAAIAYNIGGFKARLSLNFNGSFISEFDGDDIVRIDSRNQLDFSMSQTFAKKKLTAFLELINLTDENQIEFYNSAATPKERQRYGSWGRLGLRFNF